MKIKAKIGFGFAVIISIFIVFVGLWFWFLFDSNSSLRTLLAKNKDINRRIQESSLVVSKINANIMEYMAFKRLVN
ncbi:MAG: hypothetical protein JW822_04970 [Spirochaetales bacterium]|nr:hypothetical protein [Spirochaetales bacterium]